MNNSSGGSIRDRDDSIPAGAAPLILCRQKGDMRDLLFGRRLFAAQRQQSIA